jgi:hypothetical protein
LQPGTSGGRPFLARLHRRAAGRSIQSRQHFVFGPPQGIPGRYRDLPNQCGGLPFSGRRPHGLRRTPCLQGVDALFTAGEAKSVDPRGQIPVDRSEMPSRRAGKVPPAGLAALPAAPQESQGWGAGEWWTRGRSVGQPVVRTASGCAPRLRRAPGPPPLRPGPPTPSGHRLQGARRPMAPSVAGGPFPRAEQPTGSPPPSPPHGGLQQGGRVYSSSDRPRQGLQRGPGLCEHPSRGPNRKEEVPPGAPGRASRSLFRSRAPVQGSSPRSRPPNHPRRGHQGPYGRSIDVVGALRGARSVATHPCGGPGASV